MKRVLFLCTGNYYRSRFAEVMFNHLAEEAGLVWRADSCGLNLAGLGPEHPRPISKWTREGLKARGIESKAILREPKQVCEADLTGAELVIALKEEEHRPWMEKLHPEWAGRVLYWHVHDLDFAEAEEALGEIEGLVKGLVTELAGR
jgi:protein-tyrosine phosphatase